MSRSLALVLVLTATIAVSFAHAFQAPAPVANAQAQSRDISTGSSTVVTGTIRGRVVDAADGRPLRGVRIQLPSREVPDTFTDDEGRFVLAPLPAGRYRIAASKPGYVTAWRDRTGSRAVVAGPAIELAGGQIVDQVDFALPKAGVITGRVFDERGREVVNAIVGAYRARWQDGQLQRPLAADGGQDLTNDLGEFRLFGLSAATYLLSVSYGNRDGTGRLRMFYPAAFSPENATSIDVHAGEELTTNITLPLAPEASIVGTVRRDDGQPLAGAQQVSAQRISSSAWWSDTVTGTRIMADGSYKLSSLLPGEYEVTTGTYSSSPDPRLFATATVIVDGTDLYVPLTLSAGGSIHGRYRFDIGAPPRDLKPPAPSAGSAAYPGVLSVVLPHNDLARMTILPDWSFEILGLQGSYRLRPVIPAGWFLKRITLDGRDITYTPVDIAGNSIDGVEVLLTKETTRVSVSLEGGDATLENVTVLIFAEDESKRWPSTPFMKTALADLGRAGSRSFTLSGMPSAHYYAVAIAGLELGQEPSSTLLRRLESVASKIELVDGETRTVTLKIGKLP